MKVLYDSDFIKQLKKQNVRIRKSFEERILLFSKNPTSPQLKNHALQSEWKGYRSINITADYRAIYEELTEGEEKVAYFIIIGTHGELYK